MDEERCRQDGECSMKRPGYRCVHMVGIGGSGMSALAEVARGCGVDVSGSDRAHDQDMPSEVLARLQRNGCRLFEQDGRGVHAGADIVVVSTAIEADNPDLAAARTCKVPVMHRAAFLAELVGNAPCLGVAGTSGKSTVTGMVGWILAQNGRDPMVVNGASICDWEDPAHIGSVRTGQQDLWVLELDESDRSLLQFRPSHAVITNCSADHFPMDETQNLFDAFAGQVRGSCLRGPWQAQAVEVDAQAIRFNWQDVAFSLPIPGWHNVENAVAAAALCQAYGVAVPDSAAALASFRGLRRRLEVCGQVGGITVLDDFGHNPAKIRAALSAVLPYHARTIVIWRPHGYGPLRQLMPALLETFGVLADQDAPLLLLPVYDAGGTADRTIGSEDLAAALAEAGMSQVQVCKAEDVCSQIQRLQPSAGDAILVMGARDPGLPILARDLVRQLRQDGNGNNRC